MINTGIDALDRLLGGGFLEGSTVLLEGEPGTGKTTLALQIAHHFLESDKVVSFLSMEEDCAGVFRRMQSAFGFEFERYRSANRLRPNRQRVADLRAVVEKQSPDGTEGGLIEFVLDQAILKGADLCIVDSLPALIDALCVCRGDRSPREWLFHIQAQLADRQAQFADADSGSSPPIAILISEFARGEAQSNTPASYVADVVIHLQHETITPDPIFTRMQEKILRLAVLKGRGLHTQRRSCCYDFVRDRGIVFYETYAAEGIVALFGENAPGVTMTNAFKSYDVPTLFPGISVQEFGRGQLQETFGARRRVVSIPARKPMVVSNLDEYWVRDLKDKGLLTEIESARIRMYSPTVASVIPELRGKIWTRDKDLYFAVPHFVNVSLLAYRKDQVPKPPTTWEELEEICIEKRGDQKIPQFAFDCATYDTLVVFFLELCWSHGAHWRTVWTGGNGNTGKIEVVFDRGGKAEVVAALERLRRWVFDLKIMAGVGWRCGQLECSIQRNWLFARHWYSTLVDIECAGSPGEMEIGIAPIPSAESYKKERNEFHCSWGEWYLGVQRGTENVELAVEVINNLLSARKIVDRAVGGGGLPAVDEFYEVYGHSPCPYTDKTFNGIREALFRGAKSRGEFADYRKVMRVWDGVIRAVMSDRSINLWTFVDHAFARIESRED